MKIKKVGFMLIKCVLILLAASVLGVLLLALAYSIPINSKNKESSLQYSGQMGWSPKASVRYEQYNSHFDSFASDVLDDGTDNTILFYSLYECGGDVIKSVVNMQGYGRYWHGYIVILRLVFYMVDYWDFALLNGMLQIAVVFCLAFLIWKRTLQIRYCLAAVSSYLLLMPAAMAASLQFSPVFYLAFLGSIAAVWLRDYLSEKDRLYLFFLIMGIVTCYVDFLTNPLLAWAFPLCWYLVAKKDAIALGRRLADVVLTALAWAFGYVGMFFTKWGILYAVCGAEAFADSDTGRAFSYIGVLDDEYKVIKQTYDRFGVLYTNWRHYLFSGFVLIIAAWLLWAVYKRLCGNWKVKREAILYLLISLSGPAWYLVFTSHTAIHHFFTYRTFGASILAVILFVCSCAGTGERAVNRRFCAGAAAVLAVCLGIGWCAGALAKENVIALYDRECQFLRLVQEEVFECDFVPTFGDIREFKMYAKAAEDTGGTVRVRLYDDALVKYELEFPAEEFGEKVCASRYVEWKLIPGKEYRMVVSLEDNETGIDLFVTYEGTMPLNEYRNSRIDGNALEDVQPLGSFVYHATVQSRKTRLFLALVTGCYLWLCAEAVYGVVSK